MQSTRRRTFGSRGKTKGTTRSFMVLSVLFSALACRSHSGIFGLGAVGKPAPSSASDAYGVWIGYCTNTATLFRMELEPSGRGHCAHVARNKKPSVYDIENWDIKDDLLIVTLQPSARSHESPCMSFKGRFHRSWIDFEVEIQESEHSISKYPGLVLRREDLFEEQLAELRSQMKDGAVERVSSFSVSNNN